MQHPPVMKIAKRETVWRLQAKRTARKVNLGWWLETFSPALIATALVGCCCILALRSHDVLIPWPMAGASAGAALLLVALTTAIAGRKRFCSESDALVRLEGKMQLNNALSAAAAGVAPWPMPPDSFRDGMRWNHQWLWVPPLAALALLAAAFLIPFNNEANADTRGISEPPAWTQMEAMLQQLEEEEVVEQSSLEKLQERIDELRTQPVDEWYSHSSMEASDHARADLENAIQNIATNLDKSGRTLEALENHSDKIGDRAMERLLDDFAKGLQGLQAEDLKLNKELMKSLKEIDPSKLKTLSKAQLSKLREQMEKKSGSCKSCLGNGKNGTPSNGWGEMGDEELLALINGKPGSGTKIGPMPGNGGIGRGPGTAPITLSKNETQLGTNNLEGVSSDDFSRALPADLIGLSEGEHDLDKTSAGPQDAGEVGATGQGGEAVWKDSLLPSEKNILKRYFE